MEHTIYLCRHGETCWNKEKRKQGKLDSPLSEDGITQSLKLANKLKNLENTVIISSPLGRAKTTAEIVKSMTHYDLIIDNRLEEMSFGLFQGMTESEILIKHKKSWSELKKYYFTKGFPYGESFSELENRCLKFIHYLGTLKYDNIIIIGHEDTNSILFKRLVHSDINERKQPEFKQPNSCVYIITNSRYIEMKLSTDKYEK